MGYAKIISGGPAGRYTIELDYGASTRTALLTALNTLLAQLDNSISAQLAQIALADALEAAQLVKLQAAEAALIVATAGGLPPGATRADTASFRFEATNLARLRAQHEPLRTRLALMRFNRTEALRRIVYWTAFNPIEIRSAWCADLTETAPAGLFAATLDIPGESALIVLAPGCRAWNPADGILTAREIMSPEQAFLNAAILPGWQKFKPTYRWGTITAINYSANTCSVSLFASVSSARRLGVNQASSLANVPVVYSTCNAQAFVIGDRVVVEFIGQSWSAPRVIGFVDNPKACFAWPIITVSIKFDTFNVAAGGTRSWINSTSFLSSCSVTQVVSFTAAMTIAGTASHRINLHSIAPQTAVPGLTISSTVPAGTTLWTANSSAYEYSTVARVPASDIGTWVITPSGTDAVQVRVSTLLSSVVTMGAQYSTECVPNLSYTGGLFSSSATTDLIPSQAVNTWLASIGNLPVISATVGAITREYRVLGTGFASDPLDGTYFWLLQYEPIPL